MPMEGWFKEKNLLPLRCLKGNQVELSGRELGGVTWESRRAVWARATDMVIVCKEIVSGAVGLDELRQEHS